MLPGKYDIEPFDTKFNADFLCINLRLLGKSKSSIYLHKSTWRLRMSDL